jgi:hypothetical protein
VNFGRTAQGPGSGFQLHAGLTRDVPDRELADQLEQILMNFDCCGSLTIL